MTLISTGVFDVPTLLAALLKAGITGGECILAALDGDFLTLQASTASTMHLDRLHNHWLEWRIEHRPGVRYIFPALATSPGARK
jgi:hypothetical protein